MLVSLPPSFSPGSPTNKESMSCVVLLPGPTSYLPFLYRLARSYPNRTGPPLPRQFSFEFFTLLALRCSVCQKSKWNYKEFSNLTCSKDHMKYFTYIIQFSLHSTHTHEEPVSPRGLATCLMSQKLEAESRFELRPICLQFGAVQ